MGKAAVSHLRVDGEFCRRSRGRGSTASGTHSIELPVADIVVSVDNETSCARALAKALDSARAWCTCCPPLDGLARHDGAAPTAASVPGEGVLRPSAPARLRHQLPELDPRLFSYNSKHGWCTSCVGTGRVDALSSARPTTTRCATTTDKGAASRPPRRRRSIAATSRARLPRARLNPIGAGVLLSAARAISEVAAVGPERLQGGSSRWARWPQPRETDIARD